MRPLSASAAPVHPSWERADRAQSGAVAEQVRRIYGASTVSRRHGVRSSRRRRRIPAGGPAVPARMAGELLARCRAAHSRAGHACAALGRRALARLPGRARRRLPQPDLGCDNRSRRSRRPTNRPLAVRSGGHRRADRVGRHPGRRDHDRRRRCGQFMSDRPVNGHDDGSGSPLRRTAGRRVGRCLAGPRRPARLPRPDHVAGTHRNRVVALRPGVDDRHRHHSGRPPPAPVAERTRGRTRRALPPGQGLRRQQHRGLRPGI